MKKFAIFVACVGAAFLCGCGDDITNNVYQMGMQVTNVMGDCGSKNRGEMIYVTDSNAVYVCEEKGWVESANGLAGKDTVYSIDTVYSKDTIYNKDTIYSVTRDTLVKKDTVVVNRKDTVVVSKKDTLVVRDTLVQKDTVYISGGAGTSSRVSDTVTTEFLNQEMLAAGEYGLMTDPRDGQVYRTVKIGDLTWTAQNMNYHMIGSHCYGDDEVICDKYGRLYERGIVNHVCPSGWHQPSSSEFNNMYEAAGANDAAVLSAYEGGSNTSGFSIVKPGYIANVTGGTAYYSVGMITYYYCSNVCYTTNYGKSCEWTANIFGTSVRCVKDSE